MEMRIDVRRAPARRTRAFTPFTAPGLGVWRSSGAGRQDPTSYLKQVTNLSAPAYYRARVRFRWLNAKGRLIKAPELRTPALRTAGAADRRRRRPNRRRPRATPAAPSATTASSGSPALIAG